METCPKCQGAIAPGVIHSCPGPDFYAPVSIRIISELIKIRELLEKQQQSQPTSKAPRRETR